MNSENYQSYLKQKREQLLSSIGSQNNNNNTYNYSINQQTTSFQSQSIQDYYSQIVLQLALNIIFQIYIDFNLILTLFLLGGMGNNNCLQYIDKNIVSRSPMPLEKSFFAAVAIKAQQIYTFGGYENVEKCQLKSCEYYNIEKDKWYTNDELNEARSQCSAALFEDNIIFIFGGYNKEKGTLSSIERYDITKKRITLLEIQMPLALRRFASIKISASKILLLGGIGRLNKDSDVVFCFDMDNQQQEGGKSSHNLNNVKYSIENLDKIDKAGVIEHPVILDSVGSLHLFVENATGTSPPVRAVYSFLEYS